MTAVPRPGAPRCPSCGCYLAADDERPLCSPCVATYHARRRTGYRPQHDADLRTRLLEVLRAHRGERINVYRVLGMWPCGLDEWRTVRNHVRWLVRHGHTIYGYHDGTWLYVDGRGSRP